MRPSPAREPRVLHVLEAITAGVGKHVVDAVTHTPGWRHEVAMPRTRKGWTTDAHLEGAFRSAGATVHLIDMRRMPLHPVNLVALRRLRDLVSQRMPAIVHGHSSVGGALARVATWRAPVKRVYTPNALNVARGAVAIERVLGRRTDCLIAVSESERRQVAELGLVPLERIAVIPNGIDMAVAPGDAIDIRAHLGLPPGAPIVGCVARLVPQKAPDDFARVCSLVARVRPDVHFVLIGTGPLEATVDRLVAQGGSERNWRRITTMPDAWRVMDQFDVFALPSRYEGLPYAPLEAMRAGTPVVLTDVAGNREVAVDGAALLVPPGDVDAMASTVLELLADPLRRAALGARGRDHVATHFRVEAMGAALAAVYDRLSGQVNQA
jgi:glycosyltransferase involved in cell wall biosynthesis